MSERRCTYKCGDWRCGSYQFNLYKHDIDQGDLCDVHYWQNEAQKAKAVNTEPSAEDWIILRCVYEWTKGLKEHHHKTASKSMGWLIKKLGVVTVVQMIDQLTKEQA